VIALTCLVGAAATSTAAPAVATGLFCCGCAAAAVSFGLSVVNTTHKVEALDAEGKTRRRGDAQVWN
jgi:hypothetical protein